jgi:hypothetical protein
MTTLSDLQAELTHLEPHQLHQVAEFIEQIKRVSHTPKKLTDFYGAFATRSRSASKTEMRQRVLDYLAQKHKLIQE